MAALMCIEEFANTRQLKLRHSDSTPFGRNFHHQSGIILNELDLLRLMVWSLGGFH